VAIELTSFHSWIFNPARNGSDRAQAGSTWQCRVTELCASLTYEGLASTTYVKLSFGRCLSALSRTLEFLKVKLSR
jgi:hypothetical protein